MTNIIKFENQKQHLDQLKEMAKIAVASKQYKDMTESSLLNLMLTARDLGISPMKAINGGFYIVNGKVCMSTALMADRIRRAGHSIKIVEMTKDKCTIIAVRKDNGDSLKLEYTWEDATLAGLVQSMTWKKFPKVMLYNRCMSQVARILFSDVIGNSYSEEERFDIEGVEPKDRPTEDPESDVTIEVAQVEDEISEADWNKLNGLLLQDEEAIPKIMKNLSIESMSEIPQKDFGRVINWLEKRKEGKEGESSRVA